MSAFSTTAPLGTESCIEAIIVREGKGGETMFAIREKELPWRFQRKNCDLITTRADGIFSWMDIWKLVPIDHPPMEGEAPYYYSLFVSFNSFLSVSEVYYK